MLCKHQSAVPLASMKRDLARWPLVQVPTFERFMVLPGRGGSWRNRSRRREAGSLETCTHQVPGGGLCVNLPPHQTAFGNHKSTPHTTNTATLGMLLGCFFFLLFFFFCKINIHSSFVLITKIEFLSASNIQISPTHTHSREAEVRAAAGWGARAGLAQGHSPIPQGSPGQRGSREEVLRGAMADHFLGCFPPSRPTGQAAPTMEKPGVRHPGGWHPQTSQCPTVPPSATRGKIPSHHFPEMSTPKWLATGRGAGLCQSPWPHPFSGFLRRIRAQENSSVEKLSVHQYIKYILLAGGGQVLETPRDCIWTAGGLGPSTSFRSWCPGQRLLLITRALPF